MVKESSTTTTTTFIAFKQAHADRKTIIAGK